MLKKSSNDVMGAIVICLNFFDVSYKLLWGEMCHKFEVRLSYLITVKKIEGWSITLNFELCNFSLLNDVDPNDWASHDRLKIKYKTANICRPISQQN